MRVALLRGLVDSHVCLLLRFRLDWGERGGVDVEKRLAAEALDHLDGALQPDAFRRLQAKAFGPDAEHDFGARRRTPVPVVQGDAHGRHSAERDLDRFPLRLAAMRAGKKFMRGDPRKLATKTFFGRL